MSDPSAQPALLPGAAVQAGFAGTRGLSAANGPRQAVGVETEGATSQGFQAHLRALLRGSAAVDAPSEIAAAALLTAPFAVTPPQTVAVTDADPAAVAENAAAKALNAGGKNLPTPGNGLPFSSAFLARSAGSGALAAAAAPDGVATVLRPSPSSTVSSDGADVATIPAVQNGGDAKAVDGREPRLGLKPEWQTTTLDQRYAAESLLAAVRGSANQQAADQPLGYAGAGPSGTGLASLPPVAAERISEVMRRLNLQRPAAPGLTAAATANIDGEANIQSIADFFAGKGDTPRNPALADTVAAQFSLHARPADLIPATASPTVSAENVLRDLQNMMPLRPQTGDGPNGWSAGLGQRLLMMAESGVEVARLRLNPAHLGPLEIHVNVEDERAQVWFGASHGATRDALEAALPRLREMFAAQGLELTHADVNDHGGQREGARADQHTDAPRLLAATIDRSQALSGPGDGVSGWGTDSGSLDIYV